MKNTALIALAALALSSDALLAGDLQVVVEGTVQSLRGAGLTTGPFANAQIGDTVRMSVDVFTPSAGQAPFQEWYGYDNDLFRVEVNGTEVHGQTNGLDLIVWNDGPFFQCCASVDYLESQFLLNSGHFAWFVMVDPAGTMWQTTDLNQLAGSYLPPTGDSFLSIGEPSFTGDGIDISMDVMHIIDIGSIGTNYCGPAVPNSSGASATLSAQGSNRVESRRVQVHADSLPLNAFALLVTSQQTGFTPNPGGSQGNFCLGGAFGRFTSDLQFTGASGSFQIDVDIQAMPSPSGSVAVMAGSTWHLQTWFRDLNPGQTTNFSDGLSIMFQ